MKIHTNLTLAAPCFCTPEFHHLPGVQKNIFEEVSWDLKILLLKENMVEDMDPRKVSVQAQQMPEEHEGTNIDDTRSFHRRQGEQQSAAEDVDMKLKLFRLMYESVRDSDLKVKRAELINSYYVNSTSFEIGYLMGDVTDKYNVMSDIAMTLKRLYDDWKPIEHINAYEQIANQAIEMNHLIEIIRSVHNKQPIHETPAPSVDANKRRH